MKPAKHTTVNAIARDNVGSNVPIKKYAKYIAHIPLSTSMVVLLYILPLNVLRLKYNILSSSKHVHHTIIHSK